MARSPIDQLPQRQLVIELRMAIDSAIAGHRRGPERVRRLVAENPHSATSAHVLYNIGKARAAYLQEMIRADDLALADAFARVRAGAS
jgi:hypothetical protein